jgi:hypothetical protein
MRRAVIWLGIILAALLACGPLVAGPPYAGATAEQYDWQGTWESSYKKEITGPSFPWAFTRIKDAFQANFSFSMDASGKVRGEAHGSIFYRFEYDGCASISQNSCVTRCKGEGVVEGNTGERGFPIPPHPGIIPSLRSRYVFRGVRSNTGYRSAERHHRAPETGSAGLSRPVRYNKHLRRPDGDPDEYHHNELVLSLRLASLCPLRDVPGNRYAARE